MEALIQEKQPITADYVAYKTKIAWGTAKAALLELALSKQVNCLETSRGYLFWIPQKKELARLD